MADVKWIKITTSIFDDEKIKVISTMPEADAILVVWVRLLTLAGKCNYGGYIYITETIPYTEEMLSAVMNKPILIIKLALQVLSQFSMIEIDEKGIYIVNWEKHQNMCKLNEMREYNRLAKQKERELS